MFIKKLFLLISIFLVICSSLFSNNMLDIQSAFNMANRLYYDGQKDDALEMYISMTESGIASGSIYYNIGNIYMEKSDYAKAIVYYEKSLRLLGYDKDLRNNMKYAYKSIGGDIFYNAYNVSHFQWFFYFHKFSIFFILASTVTLFFIILFSIIFKIKVGFLSFANKATTKNILIICLSIFIFSFTTYCVSSSVLSQNFLIIQNNEAYVREGASEKSKNIYNLSIGEKVSIVEVYDNWYYVKMPSGLYGWISTDDGISIF